MTWEKRRVSSIARNAKPCRNCRQAREVARNLWENGSLYSAYKITIVHLQRLDFCKVKSTSIHR